MKKLENALLLLISLMLFKAATGWITGIPFTSLSAAGSLSQSDLNTIESGCIKNMQVKIEAYGLHATDRKVQLYCHCWKTYVGTNYDSSSLKMIESDTQLEAIFGACMDYASKEEKKEQAF